VRVREEDEVGQGHPAEETDFKGEDGERIGLEGGDEGFGRREVADGLDGEILEDDSEEPGEKEIGGK